MQSENGIYLANVKTGKQWDFTNDKVTEDMTLYAWWGLIPAPSGGSSIHIQLPSWPYITGPDTIDLTEGYDNTDQSYTFGGYPAPTYGISDTEPNTANATLTGNTLTIPEGLDIGSYEVTLFASNSAGTATKTVTVHVYPAITTELATEIEFFLSREDNRIDAFGGAGGPYTFTLASGAMPAGLTLNPDGTITNDGTAAEGLYDPVSVVISDCIGNSITTNMLVVRVTD